MDERTQKEIDLAVMMGMPHGSFRGDHLMRNARRLDGTRRQGMMAKAKHISAILAGSAISEEGLQDRARGTLLGLAVGNLLGIPMEGRWYYEIDRYYPRGVLYIDQHEVHRRMDDDLAQAVELAEALVESGDVAANFARRMVTWAQDNGRGMGSLTRRVIYELEGSSSPFDAARRVYEGDPRAPNGGVMRCAPVARHGYPEALVSDSAATCAVTHYADTCQWSCIIVNAVIALLLRGQEPDLPATFAAASADDCPDPLAQATRDRIPTDVLSAIVAGQPIPADASWLRQDQVLVGHTLLAMQTGLWAAVAPLDFETALRQVVEAGGDTDTNGAVVGAVLGARYGASAIPQRWLDCVPQRERIERLGDELLAISKNVYPGDGSVGSDQLCPRCGKEHNDGSTLDHCPICGVRHFGGVADIYPGLICKKCDGRALGIAGKPAHLCFVAIDTYGENPVFVDGRKCWRRFRFGGYITMLDQNGNNKQEGCGHRVE